MATDIWSPALTAFPLRSRVPLDGKVSIEIWSRLSPSTSVKLNSLAANVWLVSSLVVTVLSAAVGASFWPEALTVIVAVSVPPFPSLTVYVNVSVRTASPDCQAMTSELVVSTVYV